MRRVYDVDRAPLLVFQTDSCKDEKRPRQFGDTRLQFAPESEGPAKGPQVAGGRSTKGPCAWKDWLLREATAAIAPHGPMV